MAHRHSKQHSNPARAHVIQARAVITTPMLTSAVLALSQRMAQEQEAGMDYAPHELEAVAVLADAAGCLDLVQRVLGVTFTQVEEGDK